MLCVIITSFAYISAIITEKIHDLKAIEIDEVNLGGASTEIIWRITSS